MKLICLGSSSKGNCYLLQASDGVLMVECGITMRYVKRALRWNMRGVVGCLVSHEHKDHSAYLLDVLKCGIRVLALPEVFKSQPSAYKSFCKEIQPMQGYKVGGFKVVPLLVAHDVPCVGYVIEHEDMGRLLFVTDTMMLEYKLPGLNHLMLECNYSDAILQDNIKQGIEPASKAQRLLESHMELKTTKGILQSNDLSAASEVILLHLSDRNSNPEMFVKECAQASGLPVYIAKPGFEIELSKEPY